jgi:kynureninase
VKLHDWNVDFAVWCSYKYLNGGFGGVGSAYVHSNHFDKEYPSLDGWWGNKKETRFIMHSSITTFSSLTTKCICFFLLKDIDRECGANGFRVSTPSIHQCATLAASLKVTIDVIYLYYFIIFLFCLKIFDEINIQKLRYKSKLLTQYLQKLVETELSRV